ncbi:MAG TPA: ATP-dependent DNA helicase [Candidatus Aquilonibacter sp.]|nr:ATP-dependent DNA helicase [Candidatus Aquilonibacter sp.]
MPSTSQSASSSTPTAIGKDPSLYQFFSPGGILARTHPAYEFRRGQLQMAQAVEQALQEKRHLIVEAGTGTGKTLAYLLPVIRSGKRVIISTSTKNLQEQLFYKDVPFLEHALFGENNHHGGAAASARPAESARRLSVCYMKGRNNYLCRKKLYDLSNAPVLSGLEEIEQYRDIAVWEKTTSTGDRAELAELPEASQLWHKLDARAEACTGQKCSEFERCFITEMRRRGMESDIIIVNHHLFFADLAIKLQAEGAPDAGILPEAAAVIFDEAHELEDVAANYFGISVSNLRVEDLARDVESTLQHNRVMSAPLSGALGSLREKSQFFFSLLPAGEGRFAFDSRREFLEENGDEFLALNQALSRLAGELEGLPQKPEEIFNLVRRTQEIQMHLSFAMESEDRNTVFWIERRSGRGNTRTQNREGRGFSSELALSKRSASKGADTNSTEKRASAPESNLRGRQNVFLQATPIDVGPILRECLWSSLECAVLTSATLAVGAGFDYIRQRLGLENARESLLPSHFDYQNRALFYVPPDLPDARTPQFTVKAADRIRKILEITRGRAFVLFTSYAQMNDIYDRLLGELEFPMLRQGDVPKSALLEEFRLTPNAVLFATSSFWQGVDVQGEQLSCVIIDRLPFAVPSDPVVAARVKAIDSGGGNAFFEYQVPSAVITLKQGFGRLIRSLQDRGLLVLLDNRILKKQYGRIFIESLPNYKRTTELRAVEEFFSVGG